MTHRCGLSLSIIIWRNGGGRAKFPFALGRKHSFGSPADVIPYKTIKTTIVSVFSIIFGCCVGLF